MALCGLQVVCKEPWIFPLHMIFCIDLNPLPWICPPPSGNYVYWELIRYLEIKGVHGTNVHWMLNPNHSPDAHEAWNGFPPSSKNTASSFIRSPTAPGELQNPQPKNCRLEIKAVRSKLLYRSCILQSHTQVHSFSEEDCTFSFLCKSSSTHVYYVALQ